MKITDEVGRSGNEAETGKIDVNVQTSEATKRRHEAERSCWRHREKERITWGIGSSDGQSLQGVGRTRKACCYAGTQRLMKPSSHIVLCGPSKKFMSNILCPFFFVQLKIE
jgi:hypothetical protein